MTAPVVPVVYACPECGKRWTIHSDPDEYQFGHDCERPEGDRPLRRPDTEEHPADCVRCIDAADFAAQMGSTLDEFPADSHVYEPSSVAPAQLPCGCRPHRTRMTGFGFTCMTEDSGYCNFECPHDDEEDE